MRMRACWRVRMRIMADLLPKQPPWGLRGRVAKKELAYLYWRFKTPPLSCSMAVCMGSTEDPTTECLHRGARGGAASTFVSAVGTTSAALSRGDHNIREQVGLLGAHEPQHIQAMTQQHMQPLSCRAKILKARTHRVQQVT